jgi:Carboxypeptidase regulatory-like domain
MRRIAAVGTVLLALTAPPVLAQRFTAAIRGAVVDPTQATVEGAKVTLKGEDTGLSRTATTNSAGLYSFTELPVGSYQVTVERAGFKTATRTRIVLNVADTRAVDFELAPGEIAEAVTVEAAAVQVQTIGGDVSGLISGEQVRDLPLNGRNFVQLALLMPGVSQVDNFNTKDKGLMTGVDMSVSGGSVMSNVWTVDGANNNDVGSNRTILVYPSVDAIEEFKIQRNNYGAEFGQAGGAQINIVTRRGSNDFSGSAYYFGRNDGLNGTNYFLEQAGKAKEPLSVHDFGYTFGGPAIKDRLQFFVSQEWNREQRGTVRTALVPTLAERSGDFSQPRTAGCGNVPIDPSTGQAFPGNRIPADRLSPGGQALLKLFSAPNTPLSSNCVNWVESVTTPIHWRQDHARLDYTLTPSLQLMVRYTQDSWVNGSPSAQASLWGDDPFPSVDSNWDQPGRSLMVQLNQTIGQAGVNSLQFSYSANNITVDRGGESAGLNQELNALILPVFPDSEKHYGADRSHPIFWGGGGYPALWNEAPFNNNQDLFVLKDDYSQVFGKHFFKAGALASTNKKNEDIGGGSAFESPQFWGATGLNNAGATTGNVMADFLLKDMTWGFVETSAQPRAQIRWKDFEAYLQDSWKVHPRLTVDLGVRYSYLPNPYEAEDLVASFDPAAFRPELGNDPCNGLLVPPGTSYCGQKGFKGGTPGPNRSLTENRTNLFAPRLGLAWDVGGRGQTSLRAGLGQFFLRERINIELAQLGNPPFTQAQNGVRKLDSNREPCAGCFALGNGVPANGRETRGRVPSNWQWNLTLQHEVLKNTTLELAYVGNKGVDITRKLDINQVRPDARLAYVRASGNAGAQASFRPFGVFGDARITLHDHSGSSIYHSLQTQLISRFGHHSQLQASYTWSRLIDDATADVGNALSQLTVTDLDDPGLDRGLSPQSRQHVFNASLVLNGPTLQNRSAGARRLLADWQFATTVLASSGQPITVYVGNVPGITNGPAGTGFADNIRPNRVPGVSCRADGGNPEAWLNPAAFTLTGYRLGTSGDAGRGICDGPGIFQADVALYKTIALGRRVRAQLRFEFFNVFNNTMFTDVANVMNPTAVTFDTGDVATASTITGFTLPSNFGVAARARDPRQAQFGLKLMF